MKVVYRGMGAALANEMGQMGMQFGLTGFVKKVCCGGDLSRGVGYHSKQARSRMPLGQLCSHDYDGPLAVPLISFAQSFSCAVQTNPPRTPDPRHNHHNLTVTVTVVIVTVSII